MLKYKIIEDSTAYTGRELRSGWIAGRTGLTGDSAAGFVGPCHVANEDLVDLDDARAGTFIEAVSMANVIIEHPGCELETMVWRQRMLVALLCEILDEKGFDVQRSGDDVFFDKRKLTVSIAAPGPEGALIHLGINVNPGGAPVPAVGLEEMNVAPLPLVDELLARYVRELASVRHATTKVRSVP